MVLFCGPGGGWLLVVPAETMVFFGLRSPLLGLGGGALEPYLSGKVQ